MHRRSLLLAATLLAAAPAAFAQGSGPIPIGAIEILTGPSAAYGIAIRAGLELALDEINQKGVLGGRKIALTVEDSGGNKDGAINAARKLIGRDHVVAGHRADAVERDVRRRAGGQRAQDPDRRHVDDGGGDHRHRAVGVPHQPAGKRRDPGDAEIRAGRAA